MIWNLLKKIINNRRQFMSLNILLIILFSILIPNHTQAYVQDFSQWQNWSHGSAVVSGSTVTFNGYTSAGFGDFMYLGNNSNYDKEFTFTLDESAVNYHSFRSGGFLFGMENVKPGSNERFKGYALMFDESWVHIGKVDTTWDIFNSGNAQISYLDYKQKPIGRVHSIKLTISGNNVNVYVNGTLYFSQTFTDMGQSFGVYALHAPHSCNQTSTFVFKDLNMKLENLPPTISVSHSPTAWTNGNVTATATATDGQSNLYGIRLPNNTEAKSGNVNRFSTNYTITQNGTYPFTAIDEWGNTVTKSHQVTNIDKVLPTITVTNTSPPFSDVVNIRVQTSDTLSGVKQVVGPDGKVSTSKDYIYPVTKNGNYSFTVTDNAGNQKSASINVTNVKPSVVSFVKGNANAKTFQTPSKVVFPATVRVTLTDGKTADMPVTWDKTNLATLLTTTGQKTVNGTIKTSPTVNVPANKSQVQATLTVEKNTVISADNGVVSGKKYQLLTELTGYPATLTTVKLETGETISSSSVPVTWTKNHANYDYTKPTQSLAGLGRLSETATLKIKTGVTAGLTVNLTNNTVASLDKGVANGLVYQKFNVINKPTQVVARLSDTVTTINVPVSWASTGYDEARFGTQTLNDVGTVTLPQHLDPTNIKANLDVVLSENQIKSLTQGTATGLVYNEFNQLVKSNTLVATLQTDDIVTLGVTWDDTGLQKTKYGTQTLTNSGIPTLVAGVINPNNVKANLLVNLSSNNIVAIDGAVVGAKLHQQFNTLQFPTKLMVTLKTGNRVELDVDNWRDTGYNSSINGVQTLQDSGSVILKDGITNDNFIKSVLTINVGDNNIVDSTPTNASGKAYQEFDSLSIPDKVSVTLNSGDVIELKVNWNKAQYDKTILGKQSIEGDIVLVPSITNTNSVKAQLDIDLTTNDIIHVYEGSATGKVYQEFADITKDTQVVAILETGDRINLNVTWSDTNYDKTIFGNQILDNSGTLTLPNYITNSTNIEPDLVVKLNKNTIVDFPKYLTDKSYSVDTLYRTEPKLQSSMIVTLDTGQDVEVPITWNINEYDLLKLDTYLVSGTALLDKIPGLDLADNLVTYCNLTVNPSNLIGLDTLQIKDILYATPFENLGLVETIRATYDNGDILDIKIDWTESSYDKLSLVAKPVIGSLIMPYGYTNTLGLIPSQDINILDATIIEIKPYEIVVEYNVDMSEIKLPTALDMTLDSGTTIPVNVSWNVDAYDKVSPGPQYFKGSLSAINNEPISNIGTFEPTLIITVKEARQVLEINDGKTQEERYIEVYVNATMDEILSKLPKDVNVLLSGKGYDSDNGDLKVNWSSVADTSILGEYPVVGELVVRDNILNDRNVIYNYVVKVVNKSISDKDKGSLIDPDSGFEYDPTDGSYNYYVTGTMGDKWETLNIPESIVLQISDASIQYPKADIKWEKDKYRNYPNKQTVKGEVIPPYGIDFDSKLVTKVHITLNPTDKKDAIFVEEFDELTIPVGTRFSKLNLPYYAKVYYQNGESETKLINYWSPEGFDSSKVGKTSVTGFFSATNGESNSNGLTALQRINVVEPTDNPNAIHEIINPDRLTLILGESLDVLTIPTEVEYRTITGKTGKVSAYFDTSNVNVNKVGSQYVKGKITGSLDNPYNSQPVLEINVVDLDNRDNLEVIKVLPNTEVYYPLGTPFSNIKISNNVVVQLSNGMYTLASAYYNKDMYDMTRATNIVKGTLILPTGITNLYKLKAEQLIVLTEVNRSLNVVEVESLPMIDVYFGTDRMLIPSPMSTNVKASDNKFYTMVVNWLFSGNYSKYKAGKQIIPGDLQTTKYLKNPDNIKGELIINVLREYANSGDNKYIVDMDNPDLVVDNIDKITPDKLPPQIDVEFSDGTTGKIDVEWTIEGDKAIGRPVLPDNVKNPDNLQSEANLLEKGKDNYGSGSSGKTPDKDIKDEDKLLTKEEEAEYLKYLLAQIPYSLPANRKIDWNNLLEDKYEIKFTPEVLTEGINEVTLSGNYYKATQKVQGFRPFESSEINYSDISSKNWSYGSIMELTNRGYALGNNNGKFGPKNTIQVSDTFTFLDRILVNNNIYTMKNDRNVIDALLDSTSHWSYYSVGSILSKVDNNILPSSSIGNVYNTELTREEVADVIYSIVSDYIPNISLGDESSKFSDSSKITNTDAVNYNVSLGLFKGDTNNNFNPTAKITREELVSVLIRLDDLLKGNKF